MTRLDEFRERFDDVYRDVLAFHRSTSATDPITPDPDAVATGSDPDGLVTVTVGAGGRLRRIEVDPGWKKRGEVDLGNTIVAANASAIAQLFGAEPPTPEAVDTFDPSTVDDQLDQLRERAIASLDGIAAGGAAADADGTDDVDAGSLRRRAGISGEEPSIAMLRARSDELRRATEALAASVGGSTDDERVGDDYLSLRLGPSGMLIGADINERWAATQSGGALTMRLDDLLASGRTEQ